MINISQIISSVQNEIADISGERIQQGEYIDLLNSVAREIAQETEIYVNRYITIPNPAALLWTENTDYTANQIISYNDIFYLILVSHTSSLTNLPDTTTSLYTPFSTWVSGSSYSTNDLVVDNANFAIALVDHTASDSNRPSEVYGSVGVWGKLSGGIESIFDATLPYMNNDINVSGYRLLRVVRGTTDSLKECREYSNQAISSTTSGNNSFPVNWTQLGATEFTIQFVDRLNRIDGGLHLVFGGAFEANEICVIDFITNRPFGQPNLGISINGITQVSDTTALQKWLPTYNNTQNIPDFLENCFLYGLLYLVQQRLYNRGDDSFGNRYVQTKITFEKELRKMTAYAKMFKDNRSNLKVQPLNFLPEYYA